MGRCSDSGQVSQNLSHHTREFEAVPGKSGGYRDLRVFRMRGDDKVLIGGERKET
ncbi:hypothetical protein [Brevibacillus massiliensis]|jgi:hypothetical protein|uniref:hypothetical protein n=1 Tax=Brevibacillus massiliensis TaxID=1118054 RepID=UPI001375CD63